MLPTPTFCGSHPLAKIHFLPQARSELGDLTDLIASIREHGILQPPSIMEDDADFAVICGHRRVEAARKAGLTVIPVMIYPRLPAVQVRLLQLTENIQRAEMTEQDIHRECVALLKGGLQRIEIGKGMGVSPATVTRWLSPLECPEEAQQQFFARRLTLGQMDGIRLSDEPLVTMGLLLGGATQAAAKRKAKPAGAPAVRAAKIKCPLQSGPVVTVAGQELSLDEAIEALGEAQKAMKKARDQGLDASTAQRVWADMAAAS